MTPNEYSAKFETARASASAKGSKILNAWRDERVAARERGKFRNDTSNMSISDFAEYVKGTLDYRTGTITPGNAMTVSAVYACVNLIGGAISSMPLQFFQRTPKNDRKPYKPDEWWLLNEQPTPAWGAATAWEFTTQSLLLRGDQYWRILRASTLSPKITGFEPLHPDTVRVRKVGGRLVYDVSPQPQEQVTGARVVTYDQDDILHVPGPNFNGLNGMSQISGALKLPGSLALSADEYMMSFYKNSARPDFALETDGALSDDQITNLRNQVNDQHQGVAKAWKPLVLQGGLKVKPVTITPKDAQLMEVRKFQVEDVCRVMGVPPFMIGYTEKTTSWGSGVEQMGIGFVKYTLQRHLVKIEQEINRKIFRTARNFCEFNTAGLERGDIKTRFEAYRIALGRAGEKAWMGEDEVRRLENLEPRDDLNPEPAAPEPKQPTQPGVTDEPADPTAE